MARSPKLGDAIPLSVVGKDGVESAEDTVSDAIEMAEDTAGTMMQDLSAQINSLREQVQSLQASTAEMATKAGKAVASGARAAGETVASGARVAGDKATTTIETYPISSVLIVAGAAFLLGRLSSHAAYSQPSFQERTLDQLKHRLHDLSSRLPPHLLDSLRSSLR